MKEIEDWNEKLVNEIFEREEDIYRFVISRPTRGGLRISLFGNLAKMKGTLSQILDMWHKPEEKRCKRHPKRGIRKKSGKHVEVVCTGHLKTFYL